MIIVLVVQTNVYSTIDVIESRNIHEFYIDLDLKTEQMKIATKLPAPISHIVLVFVTKQICSDENNTLKIDKVLHLTSINFLTHNVDTNIFSERTTSLVLITHHIII